MSTASEALHIDKIYSTLTLIGGYDCTETSIGDLRVSGGASFDKSVCIGGNLTVLGTTISANSSVIVTEDINLCLGNVSPGPPDDTTANSGGIILLAEAGEAKTMLWYDDMDAWHFNQDINIGAGRLTSGACAADNLISGTAYRIDENIVLTGNSLGSVIVDSSLESVGVLQRGSVDVTRPIIDSISIGTPPILGTSEAHGLTTGDVVLLQATNSSPSLDGCHTVTVTSPTTFTVPATTSGSGTSGSLSQDKFPIDIGLSTLTTGDHTLRCGANLTTVSEAGVGTFLVKGSTGQTTIDNVTETEHALRVNSALVGSYTGVQRAVSVRNQDTNTDISGVSRGVDAINTYDGTNTTYTNSEGTVRSTGGRFEAASNLKAPRVKINSTAIDGVSTSTRNDGLNRGLIGEGGGASSLEQATGVTGLANDALLSIGVLGAVNKTRDQLAANTHSWAMGGGFTAALMGCNFDTGADQYGLYVQGNSNLNGNLTVDGINSSGNSVFSGNVDFSGTVDLSNADVIGLGNVGGANVAATNLGSTAGRANVFAQIIGSTLEFRSLIGGNNVSVTQNIDEIVFDLPDTITANIVGDIIGDIVGNVVGDMSGSLIGNVTGDITGNLYGDVFGDIVGNVFGYLIGGVTGDIVGNVVGDVIGTLFGNIVGDLTGDLTGNVLGDLTGDITGNLIGFMSGTLNGNVIGDLTGTLYGNVIGDLVGDVSGNVLGDLTGDVTGNLIGFMSGDLVGNVTGNLIGFLIGSVIGDLTGNVYAANQLKYVDASYLEQFTVSNVYTKITEFIFNGSVNLGTVSAIHVISRKEFNVASYDMRVVDFTNAKLIGEASNLTNDTYSVINLGLLGNIPPSESVWEIQAKQNTVTPGRVYSSGYSIQYNQM